MAIEIVDLPINSMVIFHSYVSLPEGKSKLHHLQELGHGQCSMIYRLMMFNSDDYHGIIAKITGSSLHPNVVNAPALKPTC
jgi:hypothetical protein